MKTRYAASPAGGLALAASAFTVAFTANTQQARLGKVSVFPAGYARQVGHTPATAAITGPATLTCLNAVSEAPSSKPAPSCHVVGPGFNTDLEIGHTAKLTGAGNVTLTCNGRGPMLRCSARVDTPPPSH